MTTLGDPMHSTACRLLLCGTLALSFTGAARQQDTPNGPTGDPRGSFLYGNFEQAAAILDEAVRAHGGEAWIRGEVSFHVRYEGHWLNQGHYERPWAHHDYATQGALWYSARRHALRWEGVFDRDGPLNGYALLGPDAGVHLTAGAREPERLSGAALRQEWHSELEALPREVLRQALAHPAGLRALGGSGERDVIQCLGDEGELLALFIDRETHLLRRVERVADWPTKGDRLDWWEFDDYRPVGSVHLAHELRMHREEQSTQSFLGVRLTAAEVGAPIDAAVFDPPPECGDLIAATDLAPRIAAPFAPLPAHDLGHGVRIIDVPANDARSLLVEFAEFTVVVEGGDNSAVAEEILDTAEALCPGKPVRYLAMSHHHPLYSGGIRAYVNRGVTVLTTAGNVEYLRDLCTRPHRIAPDSQQRHPVEPAFEVIETLRAIDDGTQRLEFHEFSTSTHTDEYVLTYVPGSKLGFLGDLLYSIAGQEPTPAGPRARAVYRLIRDLGLDVQQFSQTWFLEQGKMLIPFTELEEEVRLADELDG